MQQKIKHAFHKYMQGIVTTPQICPRNLDTNQATVITFCKKIEEAQEDLSLLNSRNNFLHYKQALSTISHL